MCIHVKSILTFNLNLPIIMGDSISFWLFSVELGLIYYFDFDFDFGLKLICWLQFLPKLNYNELAYTQIIGWWLLPVFKLNFKCLYISNFSKSTLFTSICYSCFLCLFIVFLVQQIYWIWTTSGNFSSKFRWPQNFGRGISFFLPIFF